MFLEFSVIFILVFKLTQKCTSLPSCFCSSVVFHYILHYLTSCFYHQSHTVFSSLSFTLLLFVFIEELSVTFTLSSVISSIIYSLSSVVSSNTCILSSVKSSNTFIQSSVISSQYLYPIICDIIPIPIIYIQSLWYHPIPKPINITHVPAVEICDEVGSLQSATNVYLKKLLRHVYWKNMATLCTWKSYYATHVYWKTWPPCVFEKLGHHVYLEKLGHHVYRENWAHKVLITGICCPQNCIWGLNWHNCVWHIKLHIAHLTIQNTFTLIW